MFEHVLALSSRDHVWMLALAGIICFFACYASTGLVEDLTALGSDVGFGDLAVPAAAIGLGIGLVQNAVVLALLPGSTLSYAAGPLGASILMALIGTAIGLRIALAGRRWSALGGAVIGLAAAASNELGLAAMSIPPLAHRHYALLTLAALACIAFCATGLSLLRPLIRGRGRVVAASFLTVGILSLDLVVGLTLSVHTHFPSAGGAVSIAEHWVAVGVVPTALIILVLALVSGHIGRYAGELAETEHRLQFAMGDLQVALTQAERARDTRLQFLAHMSHELRTPLNAVLGFSDLMKQQSFGPLNERYCEYLQIIHDSGGHLLDLINQVLDIAKIDAGRLELHEEKVNAGAVVKSCLQLMACQARSKTITLEVDVAADLPSLFADARIFRQIVLNLLGNAIKFTPEGGMVRAAVARTEQGLRLRISDSGIGIAADDLNRVFEPFGQVNSAFTRQHNGTGLGLPLVKEFAEAHQGHVAINSAPGCGTTIDIVFPPERLRPQDAIAAA